MQSITEIKEIGKSDFEIKTMQDYWYNEKKYTTLLKEALICYNDICNKERSKEEQTYLKKELDKMMKNKFKELNPNFSEETLNNMLNTYKRGRVIYPMDILVIDDVVFNKEAVLDEHGLIYEINILMCAANSYFHISDYEFELYETIIIPDWLNSLPEKKIDNISKFISESINSMYGKNITTLAKELEKNTNSCYLTHIVDNRVKIYINMNFYDIVRKILTKEECDIKICIQDEDNITLYYVHQHFKDDKPIWDVVKINNEIWKLSEAILKLKNNEIQISKRKRFK